ncbi:MAG: ATP/GTP-binding protein [Promethearchaeota archaeon]
MNFSYIIGTAGSGKSTLTKTLFDYVTEFNPEITSITVNLDPGVRTLPYNPHVDVRDFVDIDEIVEKYELGPNGALILASDMMVNVLDELLFEVDEYNNPDYVFVDTPGQMELFAFRNIGPVIARSLGGPEENAVVFLFDPNLCRTPTGFISTLLLSTSVQFRFFTTPQLNVLSKVDLFEESEVERILEWSTDLDELIEAASEMTKGLQRTFNLEISGAFQNLGQAGGLVPSSSRTADGCDALFGNLQRIFADHESKFV